MLNFAEQTGTCALIMIWPFPFQNMEIQSTKQSKANNTQIQYTLPHTHTWDSIKPSPPTIVLTTLTMLNFHEQTEFSAFTVVWKLVCKDCHVIYIDDRAASVILYEALLRN